MRSRDSDSPNATAPISSPTTVTLNATRRSWLSCAVLPFGEPGQRRRERDQRAHQPERRPGAHEQPRAREPPLRVEVEVGERLVELVLASRSVRACSTMKASVAAIAALRGDPANGRCRRRDGRRRGAPCGPLGARLRASRSAAAGGRAARPRSCPSSKTTSASASSARISTGTSSALATWKIAWSMPCC